MLDCESKPHFTHHNLGHIASTIVGEDCRSDTLGLENTTQSSWQSVKIQGTIKTVNVPPMPSALSIRRWKMLPRCTQICYKYYNCTLRSYKKSLITPVPWAVLPQPILLPSTSTLLLRVHDRVAGKETGVKTNLWSDPSNAVPLGRGQFSRSRIWFIITGNARWKLDSALKGRKPWEMNKLSGRHTPKSVLGKREVAFLEWDSLQKATRQRPLFHP